MTAATSRTVTASITTSLKTMTIAASRAVTTATAT
jgi:hypothetical protein